MTSQATDPHFSKLLQIAESVERDYELRILPEMWEDSPLAWLKLGLTSPARGKAMRSILERWLVGAGFTVQPLKERAADFAISGRRVKVKASSLWKGGTYRFQQIKDQRYDLLICFGLSPTEAHCWVLTKTLLLEQVIGQGYGQHTGASAVETAWLPVTPSHPQSWLLPRSGDLGEALEVLREKAAEG